MFICILFDFKTSNVKLKYSQENKNGKQSFGDSSNGNLLYLQIYLKLYQK